MLASRNGVEKYHRETWPRRTKCKEGNLAYFYDHWGYRYYDVVAQLDCDHVRRATYLAEMVRPFSDPAIGYVAAPSVCDTNADGLPGRRAVGCTVRPPSTGPSSSGTATAGARSASAPITRFGPARCGISAALAPSWLKTSRPHFLLSTAGWHGAFAINAEAHGDGPNTFAAMLVQEFQWSRSLTRCCWGWYPAT